MPNYMSALAGGGLNPITLGIDMSKWGGDYTREEAQCAIDHGYGVAIIACGPGGYGERFLDQADDAIAVGQRLEAYVFLEWRPTDEELRSWIRAAVWRAGAYTQEIKRWWLDVEDNSANMGAFAPTVEERIRQTNVALAEFDRLGIFAHIYTGGWYWRAEMANTRVFADQGRLLWESYYDGDPDIDGWPDCPWDMSMIAITQFTGTTDVCGQSVDRNAVYISDDEDEMSALEEIKKLRAAVFVGAEYGTSLSIEQRDQLAVEKQDAIIAGRQASVFDVAHSALAVALSAAGVPGNSADQERAAAALEQAAKRFEEAAAALRTAGQELDD